jgi:agmatinase
VVLVPVPFDATTSYRPGTSRGPLPERVYVSLAIDGLDPALCPHTGTPVPGGLSFRQAGFLLSALARSGREIIGFDVVEVAPGPDGDEWDGNVGARLVYKLIGWALHSAPVAQR